MKRFLGNARSGSMEVHDLTIKDKRCQTKKIKNKKYFRPDTKRQAHKEGYDNCHWCIGNSKR